MQFLRDFAWLKEIFAPKSNTYNPQSISDGILLVHHAMGNIKLNAAKGIFLQGIADATATSFPNGGGAPSNPVDPNAVLTVVPKGRTWLILAAQGAHNDPAGRIMHMWAVYGLGGSQVALRDSTSGVTISHEIALPRPFYLPAGGKLTIGIDALAAGKALNLGVAYVDLPEGEHVLFT